MTNLKRCFSIGYGLAWQHWDLWTWRLSERVRAHGPIILGLIIVALMLATASIVQRNEVELASWLATGTREEVLFDLSQAVGTTLVGATAIVFSLVLFALQVNVERLPHGLFRWLSRDPSLLMAFLASMLLALAIAISPITQAEIEAAWLVWGNAWAVVITLVLYLFAYNRALALINPARQIGSLVARTQRVMRTWGRRARRARPLIQSNLQAMGLEENELAGTDFALYSYFKQNAHWLDGARQALRYVSSMVRQSAMAGDHEASAAGLHAIVAVNRTYIESKGQSFFPDLRPFMINPFAGEGFVTDSLEHLRLTVDIAVHSRDEQLLTQLFGSFAGLSHLYAKIDYAHVAASKTEAALAATYLADAVETALSNKFIDVTMNGVRTMGKTASMMIIEGAPNDALTVIKKITDIGTGGLVLGIKEDLYYAVPKTATDQLRDHFILLLRSDHADVGFALRELRQRLHSLASMVLKVPGGESLLDRHSTILESFYSVTDPLSASQQLQHFIQNIDRQNEDDDASRRFLGHLEQWAEELYRGQKDLLLEAIEKRSHFAFDLIAWQCDIAKLLLAASTTPSCVPSLAADLRKHALWLASTSSWIPTDADTIRFVEAYRLSERLFDLARTGVVLQIPDEEIEAFEALLLSWAFGAGRERNGQRVLERGMFAIATLKLMREDRASVGSFLAAELAKEDAPAGDELLRAAAGIRERADTLWRERYSHSDIERAMEAQDREAMAALLQQIAAEFETAANAAEAGQG